MNEIPLKPIIILVRPQLPANIGAVARVMSNFACEDLRIVAPRDPMFIEGSRAMAANGEYLLEQCQVFDKLEDAISDINYLYATAGYSRHMVKPTLTPRAAVQQIATIKEGKFAILFGSERIGLTNAELNLADYIVQINTSERNPSLNIAQAVAICCYELSAAEALDLPPAPLVAPKGELNFFVETLLKTLEESGFYKNPTMQPEMAKNIRNIFVRAGLTSQDIRTLHGIMKALHSGAPLTPTKNLSN